MHAADDDLGAGDDMGMHGEEGLAELVLGADATGEGQRGGDDGDGLVFEAGVEDGTGEPVEGVLEDAGDAVVVLGRGEEDGVAGGDGLLERVDGGDAGIDVEVFVVEGDVFEGDDAEVDGGGGAVREDLEQGGAEGNLAQAAGDAEDADGFGGVVHGEGLLFGGATATEGAGDGLAGLRLGSGDSGVKRKIRIGDICKDDEWR